jgi:hypothetical protein
MIRKVTRKKTAFLISRRYGEMSHPLEEHYDTTFYDRNMTRLL